MTVTVDDAPPECPRDNTPGHRPINVRHLSARHLSATAAMVPPQSPTATASDPFLTSLAAKYRIPATFYKVSHQTTTTNTSTAKQDSAGANVYARAKNLQTVAAWGHLGQVTANSGRGHGRRSMPHSLAAKATMRTEGHQVDHKANVTKLAKIKIKESRLAENNLKTI